MRFLLLNILIVLSIGHSFALSNELSISIRKAEAILKDDISINLKERFSYFPTYAQIKISFNEQKYLKSIGYSELKSSGEALPGFSSIDSSAIEDKDLLSMSSDIIFRYLSTVQIVVDVPTNLSDSEMNDVEVNIKSIIEKYNIKNSQVSIKLNKILQQASNKANSEASSTFSSPSNSLFDSIDKHIFLVASLILAIFIGLAITGIAFIRTFKKSLQQVQDALKNMDLSVNLPNSNEFLSGPTNVTSSRALSAPETGSSEQSKDELQKLIRQETKGFKQVLELARLMGDYKMLYFCFDLTQGEESLSQLLTPYKKLIIDQFNNNLSVSELVQEEASTLFKIRELLNAYRLSESIMYQSFLKDSYSKSMFDPSVLESATEKEIAIFSNILPSSLLAKFASSNRVFFEKISRSSEKELSAENYQEFIKKYFITNTQSRPSAKDKVIFSLPYKIEQEFSHLPWDRTLKENGKLIFSFLDKLNIDQLKKIFNLIPDEISSSYKSGMPEIKARRLDYKNVELDQEAYELKRQLTEMLIEERR